MHPYLLGQMTQEHTDDLRRAAERHQLATAIKPVRRRPTLRTRAGWTLVQVGLRLATHPSDG
jgi:hypothetical protein